MPESGNGVAEIARRTAARRQQLGMSQEQLAERASISARTVRNVERAAGRPRWHTVRLLAGALGLDEHDWIRLLAGDDDPVAAGSRLGMPQALDCFAGRQDQLAWLAADDPDPVWVFGTAGVGKTALAVQSAWHLADRFPDGQLYVNMHGYDQTCRLPSSAEALSSLLVQLGSPPGGQQVPTAPVERQYRHALADRRVLVVIDNVRDMEPARPLVTNRPGCLTIITSRKPAAKGSRYRQLRLGLPSHGEARAMLASRIGEHRVLAEPAAVDEIIRRSRGLPLALAIVAARAVTRPQFRLAEIVDEMRSHQRPLEAFAGGEPRSDVRTVVSWSYQALTHDAAWAFRRLGAYTAADVSVDEMASVLGVGPARARRLLDELADAQLIQPTGNGRYAFDGLNQAYAAEIASASCTRS
jgi:transcriptional regulator with XRE-family HTH domain